ncbi:MAG: DUF2135 domain-containing protein [Burkholderiales bacterium]|nr:DUF2135 domain-containing protein [Burkholderiales bacterium]
MKLIRLYCRACPSVLAIFGSVVGGLLCCTPAVAQDLKTVPPTRLIFPPAFPIPPIRPILATPEARIPVRLESAQIRTDINGSAARTVIELRFYNPNDRILEGQLEFPLTNGQRVSAFALDINGQLRPAVAVDKAQGQQVFEDITRMRADPALLEVTRGNQYRMRVYPLPARGSRTVQLTLDQTLTTQAGKHPARPYALPLQFGLDVGKLDASVTVHGVRAAHIALNTLLSGARKLDDGKDTIVQLQRQHFSIGSNRFDLQLPVSSELVRSYQQWQDKQYFYAEVPVTPTASFSAPRPPVRELAILWDASGSGAERDHDRELAALDAYFADVKQLQVKLLVLRDQAEAVQSFTVHQGDWSALRAVLQTMTYDGATDGSHFVVPAGADLALLFSDGLTNYGEQGFPASPVPMYALLASRSADRAALRAVAENSGGQLLDVSQRTPAELRQAIRYQQLRLVALQSNTATALVAESVYPDQGRLRVAGQMTAAEATLTLILQTPQGKEIRQQVALAMPSAPSDQGQAAALWAGLKLAQLQENPALHRAEIRRLGHQFNLATPETSLLVLDSVQDYVRYEILPPADLQAEYTRLLAQKTRRLHADHGQHLEKIVTRFQDKQRWWEKDFPKDTPPKPKPEAIYPVQARVAGGMPMMESMPAPAPALALRNEAVADRMAPDSVAKQREEQPGGAAIRMKKWEPDAPYYRRLHAAKNQDLYAIYLDERGGYVNSSAFFLDAADLFLERGQTALGLRILSNLAEMQLENRHILRLLAYRLMQANQAAMAIPVLQQVQELSPDEPQSYRDLGLAYAAAGQAQRAIEQLWQVIERPWHDRFPDIELIAIAEMNAIIAQQAPDHPLDTSRMDSRLLRNLPLDVRAVLSWDADNTDIDLWVTDPNGEKAFYAHPLTYQGGRMSRDFTGGYGPEEFSLRHAKPGKYRVEAEFYGHRQQLVAAATTLMLKLSTGFGTAAQKDQMVVLRLQGKKDRVLVGEFEIAAPPAAAPK